MGGGVYLLPSWCLAITAIASSHLILSSFPSSFPTLSSFPTASALVFPLSLVLSTMLVLSCRAAILSSSLASTGNLC